MKVSNSMNCLGFAVGAFLLLLCAERVEAQNCTVNTDILFIQCLSNTTPGTITVNANITVDLSGRNLTGFTVDLNGFTLTTTGNPTVSITTSFTTTAMGNAGSLVITNSRGETATFDHSGSGSNFKFSDLNDQLATPANNTLHKAAIAAGATILPVTLSGFDAQNLGTSIALQWSTSSELNNAKFELQHSTEGELFGTIMELAGAGTSTEKQSYQFIHHTPSAGINYYRLKQVDFDGTFEYSKIVAINAVGNNDIVTYPNPAKDKVYVQYDRSKGPGKIYLLDALGRRIGATINGNTGFYEINLPNDLPFGAYWLKIERSGKVQTVAVVKE